MKGSYKLLAWLLIACMLLTLCLCAMAEGDEEEVSITIFDADGRAVQSVEPQLEPTPEPTADPTVPVLEGDGSVLLTMSFTGDFTIGENVQYDGKSIFDRELDKQKGDIHFPFRNVRELLLADDLTMINFEGTLTTADRNPEKRGNSYLFRANPEWVEMLPAGGVDTVSLENNHVLDMGQEGLDETKRTLLSAGISYASENEPAVFYVKGVKIGSLAYQTFGGRHDELIARVPGDIQALRDEGCEMVIVSYHWGDELDYAPNNNQVRLGRATVDAGADLVIGHHSHRINPIECYKGKYIVYSLGNFVFSGNSKPRDMDTFIFQQKLIVSDDGVTDGGFRVIPCSISSVTAASGKQSGENDFAATPFAEGSEAAQRVIDRMLENGKGLEFAVESYPTQWD